MENCLSSRNCNNHILIICLFVKDYKGFPARKTRATEKSFDYQTRKPVNAICFFALPFKDERRHPLASSVKLTASYGTRRSLTDFLPWS